MFVTDEEILLYSPHDVLPASTTDPKNRQYTYLSQNPYGRTSRCTTQTDMTHSMLRHFALRNKSVCRLMLASLSAYTTCPSNNDTALRPFRKETPCNRGMTNHPCNRLNRIRQVCIRQYSRNLPVLCDARKKYCEPPHWKNPVPILSTPYNWQNNLLVFHTSKTNYIQTRVPID